MNLFLPPARNAPENSSYRDCEPSDSINKGIEDNSRRFCSLQVMQVLNCIRRRTNVRDLLLADQFRSVEFLLNSRLLRMLSDSLDNFRLQSPWKKAHCEIFASLAIAPGSVQQFYFFAIDFKLTATSLETVWLKRNPKLCRAKIFCRGRDWKTNNLTIALW